MKLGGGGERWKGSFSVLQTGSLNDFTVHQRSAADTCTARTLLPPHPPLHLLPFYVRCVITLCWASLSYGDKIFAPILWHKSIISVFWLIRIHLLVAMMSLTSIWPKPIHSVVRCHLKLNYKFVSEWERRSYRFSCSLRRQCWWERRGKGGKGKEKEEDEEGKRFIREICLL